MEVGLITNNKLEQLECLISELPTPTPRLPILVINIRSQVKTRQSQRYKFLKIVKISNFEIKHDTRDTPSEVA